MINSPVEPSSPKVKTRIPTFSVARSMGILLVLIGHAEPIRTEFPIIWKFIYSFHMPLFFFLGGLFYSRPVEFNAKSFFGYFQKNLLTLGLPYLTVTVAFVAIKLVFSGSVKRHIEFSQLIHDVFCSPWDNPARFLWFIYVMLEIRIIVYFLCRLPKWILVPVVFGVLAIQIDVTGFMGLSSILYYLPYYLAGLLLADQKNSINTILSNIWIGVAALACLFFLFVQYSIDAPIPPHLVRSVMAISGIIFILSISTLIKQKIPRFIEILDLHALEIYLLQFFFIFPVSAVLLKAQAPSFVIVIASFLSGLLGSLFVITYIVSRSRLVSFLLLGQIKKK